MSETRRRAVSDGLHVSPKWAFGLRSVVCVDPHSGNLDIFVTCPRCVKSQKMAEVVHAKAEMLDDLTRH